jgi:hypothetical protein
MHSSVYHLFSLSAYFFTLKMKAICYSETSVDSQRTTRRYIPEDGILREYEMFRCPYAKLNSRLTGPTFVSPAE